MPLKVKGDPLLRQPGFGEKILKLHLHQNIQRVVLPDSNINYTEQMLSVCANPPARWLAMVQVHQVDIRLQDIFSTDSSIRSGTMPGHLCTPNSNQPKETSISNQ